MWACMAWWCGRRLFRLGVKWLSGPARGRHTWNVQLGMVKQAGGRHRVVVETGERGVQFAMADYGDRLPHDLVHLVVEQSLGLDFGFGVWWP